jgi:hypothetical protein
MAQEESSVTRLLYLADAPYGTMSIDRSVSERFGPDSPSLRVLIGSQGIVISDK